MRRVAIAAVALAAMAAPAQAAETRDLTRYVNVFTGTEAGAADFGTGGGAGNTFPGATVPFGMVQWSPDTEPSTVNFGGGYSHGDTRIRGFSLTHMSGPGCAALRDVPFLPTTAPVTRAPGRPGSSEIDAAYLSDFNHADESAAPGHYRVRLNPGTPSATDVQLTATTRTGAARIGFPAGGGSVLVNAGGSAMANRDAEVALDPERNEISGTVESGRFCFQRNSYRLHFAAEFSRPFAAYGTWRDQTLTPGSTSAADHSDAALNYTPIPGGPPALPGNPSGTAQAGAYATFDGPVEVRVGVSYTSVDAARANLRAESPSFEFDGTRARAREAWNRALGAVRVSGGPKAERRTFYTMLYRALLHPNVYSDGDGRYLGMDGAVHLASRFVKYANFSGWDVYRTQIPLLAMLDPARTEDIVDSLLADARDSGCLPKWQAAGGQTDVMIGDPADPAIASAAAFGARAFDRDGALSAMRRGADETCRSQNAEYVQRQGLADYLRLGYVPHEGSQNTGAATSTFGSTDSVWGSASTTLEYALADFAIAQFAAGIGFRGLYDEYMRRSANWRNVFDPATRHAWPRSSAGPFQPGHDPASSDGFAEGSSAQYTWLVPHDPAGLIDALGGRAAAIGRLDDFFAELNAGVSSRHAFLGNEPNLHVPWLYAWVGRPDAAQRVVRRALLELFAATPGGYPGNDDLGAMSAWYVLGAIGLYPAIPGVDALVLGGPLFPRIDLALPGGTVAIRAAGAAPGRPYVKSLRRNGRPFAKPWIRFASLVCGARLDYRMAGTPKAWGASASPPSFPPGALVPQPRRSKRCPPAG
jgi:predicted alpha-1,2-mannosidase